LSWVFKQIALMTSVKIIIHFISDSKLQRKMHYLLVWSPLVTFHRRSPARVVGFCLIPSSTRHLHRTRSSASAPSRSSHLRSEFIVSHHLCFGQPLGRTPSTVISDTLRMSSSLSLLLTCPYHCIRLFLTRSLIVITLASAVISSFGL